MEKLFVLGGRDAEMIEIEKVLLENKVSYKWHPSGKSGWINIESDFFPVDSIEHEKFEAVHFVECRPDKDIPNAIIIDHHGNMAKNPPSLLQVLDVLGLKPTQEQKVIAFDDAGGPKNVARHMGSDVAIAHARKKPPSVGMDEMSIEKRNGYWVINMEHARAVEAASRIFIEFGDYPTLVFFDSNSDEVNVFTSSGDVARRLNAIYGGWMGGAALYDLSAPECFWGGYVKKRDQPLIAKIVKEMIKSR